ncbi:hypothetical protein M0805_001985 [Coniferiporia weirii]|nr:hypothetical protein M0805_001985 [Coniferiporia weirii]
MSQHRINASWFVNDKGASPDPFSFHQESGQSYRPFIDPKRVRANDLKKGCGMDPRIHVKGVPASFLGIMDTSEVSYDRSLAISLLHKFQTTGTADTWHSQGAPTQSSLEFFPSSPELDFGSEFLHGGDRDEGEDDLTSQSASDRLSLVEGHKDERSPIEDRVNQWLAAQPSLHIDIPPDSPSPNYSYPRRRAALISAYGIRRQADTTLQSSPLSACLTAASPNLEAFFPNYHSGKEIPCQGGDGASFASDGTCGVDPIPPEADVGAPGA